MSIRSLTIFAGLACVLTPLVRGQDAAPVYMALGDSITFGLDLGKLVGPSKPVATDFTGYPELLGRNPEFNLSCPGQTSRSFYEPNPNLAPEPQGSCRGWKAMDLPLHYSYTGTQLQAAVDVLKKNKSTIKLVTINIGGNDLILVQETCAGALPSTSDFAACVASKLPGVLLAYQANLATIFTALRYQAGYRGDMVLLTYFSPDYTDLLQTGAITSLNATALVVSKLFGVKVADGFTAFLKASTNSGLKPCAAGLLNPGTAVNGVCDVHPSRAGQQLLADTVRGVL